METNKMHLLENIFWYIFKTSVIILMRLWVIVTIKYGEILSSLLIILFGKTLNSFFKKLRSTNFSNLLLCPQSR